MILIVSDEKYEDMSIALYEALLEKSTDAGLISQSKIPCENNLTLFMKGGRLSGEILTDKGVVNLSDINAVYTRLGTCGFDIKLSPHVKKQIEIERFACINMLFEHLDAMVINRTKSQFFNSSKLFQSRIISKYGFKIPDSLISNNSEEVKAFIKSKSKQGVIYKSASSERSMVKKFKAEDKDKLDLLKVCPHLFQECIKGDDIRVHALASGEVFACKIHSETGDYRYDKKRNIKVIDIPHDLKKKCIKMTLDMGLYLSGIDLRKTKEGDYYCFEVNPSPAFTWYEMQTGLPITKSVADMMINSDKYKNKAVRKY